jgi:integrase
MAALAAFGTWCESRQYIVASTANPNPLTKHKPLDEPELAVGDPSEEQVATFLNALGERWIAASVVLADTGLRKSELERLERKHMNLEAGKATVTRTKNRKKARTVFLTPRAIEAVRKLPERADGCVFGPLGDQRRAFRNAAKAAGFEKVRLHDLRHFFATRLLRTGADIREVMAAGGWTSLRMVQRYTHVGENRLKQATARLASAQQTLTAGTGTKQASSSPATDTPQTLG